MPRQKVFIAISALFLFLIGGWAIQSWMPNATFTVYVHANGTRTEYSGTIPNTTECTLVSSGISAPPADPSKLTLVLSVQENAEPCEQSAGEQSFFISYEAQDRSHAIAGVQINGNDVPFTVVPR